MRILGVQEFRSSGVQNEERTSEKLSRLDCVAKGSSIRFIYLSF
jgi:hypothetical protein